MNGIERISEYSAILYTQAGWRSFIKEFKDNMWGSGDVYPKSYPCYARSYAAPCGATGVDILYVSDFEEILNKIEKHHQETGKLEKFKNVKTYKADYVKWR